MTMEIDHIVVHEIRQKETNEIQKQNNKIRMEISSFMFYSKKDLEWCNVVM